MKKNWSKPTAKQVISGAALIIVVLVLSLLLGTRLAGSPEVSTELGKVSFQLQPSLRGELNGYVPVTDWGVRFKEFWMPLKVNVELRSLERENMLSIASGDEQIVYSTETKLKQGFINSLAYTLAVCFLTLIILLAILYPVWKKLFDHRWLLPAAAISAFILITIAVTITLKAEASHNLLDKPTFYASGDELQRILEVVNEAEVESAYGIEFENIVKSVSTVLSTQGARALDNERSLYLGSDLHANPLVIKPVSEIVGESPLLLTGDFAQRGDSLETALLSEKIAASANQIVAVSGNHDSREIMRELAKQGVLVLDRRGALQANGSFVPPTVRDVEGIAVAGIADPLEFKGGERVMTVEAMFNEREFREKWISEAVDWFIDLNRKPDLLMLHQHSLASGFAEQLIQSGFDQALTIATGHTHSQSLEKNGSIAIVNSGTIGAGGMFEAGETGIGLAHLLFNRDRSLRTVEFLLVEPFSGAAQANRIEISSFCVGEEKCKIDISPELIGR